MAIFMPIDPCTLGLFDLNGRRGIAPTRDWTPFFENALNLNVCIKFNFFFTIFLSLSDIIRIKSN